MNADPPQDPSVSVPVLERIDRICLKFESAWKTGEPPQIEVYLAETGGAERARLLCELVLLDLDYRSRRDQQPTPEDYRRRLPGDTAIIHDAFALATARGTGNPKRDPTILAEGPRSVPGTAMAEKIGKYRVVERLGRGGQASVWVCGVWVCGVRLSLYTLDRGRFGFPDGCR